MNKSKIEWCDYTWSPITGCRHNCKYCYARGMTTRFAGDVRLNKMAKSDYSLVSAADGDGKLYVLEKPMLNETGNALVYPFGFEPTFHRYRMDYPAKLKMGKNIFVGAMADMFGSWVPDNWIREVMAVCDGFPIHNYLFLTKNPLRYGKYGVPTGMENLWFGTTITMSTEVVRAHFLPEGCKKFVSIEPLLADIRPEENKWMFKQVDWVIIGAETGRNRQKTVPRQEWVRKIVQEADAAGIPVFMKDSLVPIVGDESVRRDFPDQLMRSEISPKMEKRLFSLCAQCNARMKKSDMITLLARSRRGEQPKQFGFICKGCFRGLCSSMGLDVPKLVGLGESAEMGMGDSN